MFGGEVNLLMEEEEEEEKDTHLVHLGHHLLEILFWWELSLQSPDNKTFHRQVSNLFLLNCESNSRTYMTFWWDITSIYADFKSKRSTQ